MVTITSFWVIVAFYVIAKICLFTGIYMVTKAIEKRALREKKQRLVNFQLYELETLIRKKELSRKNTLKDQELFRVRHKRYAW